MWNGVPRILVFLSSVASLSAPTRAQIHTWFGDTAGDLFGLSVDRIGDVDGDGFDEVIVGAPHINTYQSGTSSYARVFSGRSHAVLYEDRDDGNDLHKGAIVLGIGDWTGDGVPDYLVATAPHPDYTSAIGSARVFSGADGALDIEIPVPGWSFYSHSACAAGDVNADGFADLVLGEPNASSGKGMARVYAGPDATLIRTIRGSGPDVHLGFYLAGVGDWNDDGRDEIALGTIPQGTQHTDVYDVIDGERLFRVEHAGEIGDPGDHDDDGHRDLLVEGTLHSGLDGDPLLVMTGWFRFRPAPDVSCDGVADFLAGLSGEGSVAMLSGADGSVLEILYDAGGAAGADLALAGDADGDGVEDVLFGSPSSLPAGAARLIGGYAPPPPTNYCVGAPNSAGFVAEMGASGSREISSNDLRLHAYGCPPNQTGLFFYGPDATQTIFGNGFLCVGGGIHRLGLAEVVGDPGIATYPVDFTAPPMNSGTGQVLAGSTWRFQFWYRDPLGGGARFNLSDGLAITFCQ